MPALIDWIDEIEDDDEDDDDGDSREPIRVLDMFVLKLRLQQITPRKFGADAGVKK